MDDRKLARSSNYATNIEINSSRASWTIWYHDENGEQPMSEAEANTATTAFAKWVPDYVLSVKAQVNKAALDDNITNTNRAAIRLLTSVDSRDYQSVGFDVVRGDYPDYTYHLDSKNVYTQVRVMGGQDGEYETKRAEEVFGSDSHFFETVIFKNMPNSAVDIELKATPYWVTVDGTRVVGKYSIKTVNLGRSWVYIGSGETVSAEGEYGTHGHPYSDFSKALESVVLKENGKIYIRSKSTVQVGSDFKWPKRGNDFTILGESENGKTTETLDFSNVKDMRIGDSVTFSNMTLAFNGIKDANGKVFANGNRFKICEDVVSENPYTYVFGGGYYSTSVEKTDITILAGNYKNVYAGANGVKDSSGTIKSGVVTGDSHVTFGGTAKAQYVCGGGGQYSETKGTCHVEFTGDAIVEGIYGGGITTTGENAHTSVIMSGGTVEQIFGGNQAGMTGNVYVEINGGTVTRRVYGGCYNDWKLLLGGWQSSYCVDGYITVVIKDNAVPICNTDDDRGILACSRRETKSESETGVLIFNHALFDTYKDQVGSDDFSNIVPYDYIVKAKEDGQVFAKTDLIENEVLLSVKPDSETIPGTITDKNSGTVTYFKGAGTCVLPTMGESETQCEVEVDFTPLDVQGKLDKCESRIEGIYYSTLEDAVDFAKARKDTPVVTLMMNVEIEDTISVANGQTLKIQSEEDTQVVTEETEYGQAWKTITGTNLAKNLFTVASGGTLKVDGLNLTGGLDGVNTKGSLDVNNLYIHGIAGVGIYQTAGKTTAVNFKIEDAKKFGVFVTAGTADLSNAFMFCVEFYVWWRDG